MSVLSFSALLNWVITEKSKPHGHCHTRDSKDLLNVVRQEKLAPPRHQPPLQSWEAPAVEVLQMQGKMLSCSRAAP